MTFSGMHLTAHDAPLLGVNIDHVATVRNARGGRFPDPVQAALWAVEGGADILLDVGGKGKRFQVRSKHVRAEQWPGFDGHGGPSG